ncbi:MAG: hypothetical protein K2N72_04085 [Oscillospiraceae bacterium]|nr:hypothetical protein [Oscillospiraceae bacterium]
MDYYNKHKYKMFGVNDENSDTEIPAGNIIKESITKDHQYIIFINPNDSKILVNTYYKMKGNKVSLCIPYTRKLCDTLEEYKHLSTEYIESEAYGSWMDGAR